MEKKCGSCQEVLPLSEFYKSRTKDEYYSTCKDCNRKYLKGYRTKKMYGDRNSKEDYSYIKISCPQLRHYCEMWELLSKIGYDLDKPIAEQFNSKYGLNFKPRSEKSQNLFEVKDCQKKTPTNDCRGLEHE